MHDGEDVVVGIEVAKAAVDIAVRPQGEEQHLANDAVGIGESVAWLQGLHPQMIVVEATGGYEAALVAELGVAGLPLAVGSPHGKCASLPARPGAWPRPIGWMPRPWPISARRSARPRARCLTQRRRRWRPSIIQRCGRASLHARTRRVPPQ